MRDIQAVLERWGGWVSGDHAGVGYSHIAAGFKGLLPQSSKSRLSCCDDDGLIIEGCMARLKARRPDEHDLIVLHYAFNIPKRSIAKTRRKDEKMIRIALQMGENFIDGCLAALDVELDMDPEIGCPSTYQKTLVRSAKTVVM